MGWYEYIFGNSESRYRWVSILIIFKDGGNLVLDKGYVFLGDIPNDYLGYYCNLTNFCIIDSNLYYFYKTGVLKQIDPKSVLIHVKFGQAPFEISKENIKYWNLFFSSMKNPIYKSIKNYLNEDKIHMLNLFHSTKKRLKSSNSKHPLFSKKQIYGEKMDQVIFSELNLDYL